MINEIKILPIREPKGKERAFVTIKYGDFWLGGMRIIEGTNGFFLGMPSRKKPDGSYQDIYFPGSKDFREKLNQTIVSEFLKTTQNPAHIPAQKPDQNGGFNSPTKPPNNDFTF